MLDLSDYTFYPEKEAIKIEFYNENNEYIELNAYFKTNTNGDYEISGIEITKPIKLQFYTEKEMELFTKLNPKTIGILYLQTSELYEKVGDYRNDY